MKKKAVNTLLRAGSHHTKKQNCVKQSDYKQKEKDLYSRFRECAYSHRQLRRVKQRAVSYDRNDLLHGKINKKRERQRSQILSN